MKYLNRYVPPPEAPDDLPENVHLDTPPEEYDLNFSLGEVKALRTKVVELRPFIPSLHAEMYYRNIHSVPGIADLLSLKLDSVNDVCRWLELKARRSSCALPFLIFASPSLLRLNSPSSPEHIPDPTASPDTSSFLPAGMCPVYSLSPDDLCVEIGMLLFPAFIGTGVSTQAVALALDWAMSMPSEGGLGMRRAHWSTSSSNLPAQKLAERMGFKFEGIVRHEMVLREGQKGNAVGREEDAVWPRESRSMWSASVTCEDWEEGTKDRVKAMLES